VEVAINPHFQTHLVNDPFGDPALYVEFKFERRALLLDLGDLAPLTPRKVLRTSHVFVSHTHMDHFAGFDRLLRLFLGRDKRLHLFGPAGFLDRVEAKLRAYSWNLAPTFATDLTFVVTEVADDHAGRVAEFHLKERFARREARPVSFAGRTLIDEPALAVRFAILDHGIPCLAFAVEESRHINVWCNEVEAMGLNIGSWLKDLKDAVLRGEADNTPIPVRWRACGDGREATMPLGELKRRLLSITPGQRIVYVTDVAPHARNFAAIIDLARDADQLYAEAVFLDRDRAIATARRHLTARQAGTLARRAGVLRFVPFHFSPRYATRGEDLVNEAMAAFGSPEPQAEAS
jgi:ribonuclease Z